MSFNSGKSGFSTGELSGLPSTFTTGQAQAAGVHPAGKAIRPLLAAHPRLSYPLPVVLAEKLCTAVELDARNYTDISPLTAAGVRSICPLAGR